MMIYIPEEWENEQTQVVPLYITENKKLRPGRDFGGHVILTSGKITQVALTTGPGNVLVISIIVNDTDTNYQIANHGIIKHFIDPLVVAKGDVIKFRTLVSSGDSGNVIGANISMLIISI